MNRQLVIKIVWSRFFSWFKFACVLFYREILKRNLLHTVKIVNIVHDEILVEAPEEIIEDIAILLKDCMEKAADPFCKIISLKAIPEIGDYWIH